MDKDAKFYAERSAHRFENDDVEGGISDLDYAIQLDPNNLEYYQIRASLRYHGKQYQSAIDDFAKIIELSKDIDEIVDIYHKRAISHEKLGLQEHLLKDLDWLIEKGFGTAVVYSWRGLYRLRMADYESAIKDFTTAYQLHPESSDDLLQRAQARYGAEHYEEAIQDLTQILESYQLAPLYLAAVYTWRGRVYYKMGKREESLSDFNEAMHLKNESLFPNATLFMKTFYPEDVGSE